MTETEYKPGDQVRVTLDGYINERGAFETTAIPSILLPNEIGRATKVELLERPEPKAPDLVPGMVFEDGGGTLRVILPNESWCVIDTGKTWSDKDFDPFLSAAAELVGDALVFDPRDAKALPNPLGVRVGDRVRRVAKGDYVTTTTEFQVNHIDRQIGYAYPKYGLGHPVGELEVVGRETADRLPAGTIVRYGEGGTLRLVTEDGWINLTDGTAHTGRGVENDVRGGGYGAEVIYLPDA